MRQFVGRVALLAGVIAGGACGRPDATPGVDSAPPVGHTATAASSPRADWIADLGQALVVPADSDGTGIVLFPDAPSPRLLSAGSMVLLSPAGDSLTTSAALVVSDSQVCGEAPTIRLGDSVSFSWSVGLIGKRVAALRMDSLAAMPARDSLRMTVELTRLASTVPMDPASRFKGLPFAVLNARMYDVEARSTVVAHLVRRLAQEAAPLEEHTFVIAESDSARQPRQWSLVYQQRSEGSEETAEQYEVLAAVSSRAMHLLLLARHRDTQSTYEVLERAPHGGWRSRWHRILSC